MTRLGVSRRRLVLLVLIAALVTMTIWLREPLVAWFTLNDRANPKQAEATAAEDRPATQPASQSSTQPATRPATQPATRPASSGITDGSGPVSHEGHGHRGSDPAYYTCSMHPSVRQQEPGICPICSMDLTPVTWDEKESGVVVVDSTRRQEFGVRTGLVITKPAHQEIRAVGRVTYDETRFQDVTLKFGGWIDDLRVNRTGQMVNRGQTLFTLYSPELFAAQKDFLLALRSRARSSDSEPSNRVEYLVGAARERLGLWDLSDHQIEVIASEAKPIRSIPVPSPVTGHVIEKDVVEGAAIQPGQRVYRIAGLDRVWIEAEVYEADLSAVAEGQTAKIELPQRPGQTFEGEVAYVYPYLDAASRTGRIRIELANPGLVLRPDMYANVEIHLDLGERLLVPRSAVIYTGPRRLVFIDLGEGRLRPQEVEIGPAVDGYFEVVEGLHEGQRVVTSGNFLVAAESRIRSATTFWEAGDDNP